LKKFAAQTLEQLQLKDLENVEVMPFRGEDIPKLVEKLNKNNIKTIGITGEDLFTEYYLRNKSQLKILKRIVWTNDDYLFKKPTLCLMGPAGKKVSDFKGPITVTINKKYKQISKRFLEKLSMEGYRFVKKYMSGQIEDTVKLGLADICIEIVCSGKSAIANGLEVYESVFSSDLVVIGEVK
jgi:ATP phosphoribosyltransferase